MGSRFAPLDAWAKDGHDRLPYGIEISSDLLTPVSALLSLTRGRGGLPGAKAFLLESAAGGEQVGRFSFLGIDPFATLTCDDGRVTYVTADGAREDVAGPDPFMALGAKIAATSAPRDPKLPPFQGGAVGYLSYEMARHRERLPTPPAGDEGPEAVLQFFDKVLAFDHLKHRVFLIGHVRPRQESVADGVARLHRDFDACRAALAAGPGESAPFVFPRDFAFDRDAMGLRASLGREAYMDAVGRIKAHIRDGDVFQCVLSDRFRFARPADPMSVYRALRAINPSPYLFYLADGQDVLMGASPEMLVQAEGRVISTCPIAGTRPRGATPAEDAAREKELLRSVKEQAEHLMLVDLGRNDIGRVAEPGSVTVPRFQHIERFSHVMHLVSLVQGRLAKGRSAWDALASAFPAGTLTGAPKIRAMEVIAGLERERRGPYGGAVVCHDFSGNLNSCITIRSIFCRGDGAFVQAGAGVVADSRAAHEYEEVLNKSKAPLMAVALAEAIRGESARARGA